MYDYSKIELAMQRQIEKMAYDVLTGECVQLKFDIVQEDTEGLTVVDSEGNISYLTYAKLNTIPKVQSFNSIWISNQDWHKLALTNEPSQGALIWQGS